MKKINIAVAVAVAIFTAIPLMAQTIEELNSATRQVIQSEFDQQRVETIKKDLEKIKEINSAYNSFLDYIETHKTLGKRLGGYSTMQEINHIAIPVYKITDDSMKSGYRRTINSVQYNIGGEYLSLYDIYLRAQHLNDGPALEFLLFGKNAKSYHPTTIADNTEAIKNLNTQHSKFIDFMLNSENLQGKDKDAVAQKVLIEINNLGRALDELENNSFKDSYIKTLNSIKYYFAYNGKIVTFEQLYNDAENMIKSVYPAGLPGVRALKTVKSINSDKQLNLFQEIMKGMIETFQHEK